jgi:multidrug efflux pump subunit AcrB
MLPWVTLSFNLASGVALGQATTAIQNAEAQLGAPTTSRRKAGWMAAGISHRQIPPAMAGNVVD